MKMNKWQGSSWLHPEGLLDPSTTMRCEPSLGHDDEVPLFTSQSAPGCPGTGEQKAGDKWARLSRRWTGVEEGVQTKNSEKGRGKKKKKKKMDGWKWKIEDDEDEDGRGEMKKRKGKRGGEGYL
ncbi:hypothetical protein N7471_007939 [Penicillium samsonianum]|uniref:uncharacterized protein n=1 Tax=Penicillium samsonianum TaxID=1882272 RepID=UPI002548EFAE|nr:uncharacterized protein N7471_007939 [Penicillium samsonianum]KAJ6132724.1 hypothetical protein N7471_007939 [Penicillium samsonianum]